MVIYVTLLSVFYLSERILGKDNYTETYFKF